VSNTLDHCVLAGYLNVVQLYGIIWTSANTHPFLNGKRFTLHGANLYYQPFGSHPNTPLFVKDA
jgi:hypothetical protein